jgi:hypothetical protein
MLRGIGRFWSRNRAAVLPYLVLVCIFPLTYYLTHSLMDYRQPIEPAILVLAVSGALPFRRLVPSRGLHWIGAERALEPEFVAESTTA